MLDSEEEIADTAKDLWYSITPPTSDPVIKTVDLARFPTGTLIVSRASCVEIMYHNNDLHCHASILLWFAYDGSDRLSMRYEPGKTRPMILELDPYNASFLNVGVNLSEIGSVIRKHDYAHCPRPDLLAHPRYLEIVEKLVRILPLTHHCNNVPRAALHKWIPFIVSDGKHLGYASVRDYYFDLASSDNPLASSLNQLRFISSTCVDFVMDFCSLLHEELFIRLTPDELEQGKIPAESRIFSNSAAHDVATLLKSDSEAFQLYERESAPLIQAAYSILYPMHSFLIFFLPNIVGIAVIACLLLFLKPVIFSVLGNRVGLRNNTVSNTTYHS